MNNLISKKRAYPGDDSEKKLAELTSGALPNSVMESIARGTMAPTSAMLGHRESLAPSLQEKMQGAFGADFGNVEIYRSETAKAAGFNGIASGNKIALSPDVNLNSRTGQTTLGHELSHVVAQSQGIGTGSGFLGNASLERQADIQGERAANGMRAMAFGGFSAPGSLDFSSPTTTLGSAESASLTPISATQGAFGSGAPMQGEKQKGDSAAAPTTAPAAAAPQSKEAAKLAKLGLSGKDTPVSPDELSTFAAQMDIESIKFFNKLSPEESRAAIDYTSADYKNFNRYLQDGGVADTGGKTRLGKATGHLQSAMGKYTTKAPLTVYRVLDSDRTLAMAERGNNPPSDDTSWKGKLLKDPGFMSTSINPNLSWSGEYRLVIRIPAGVNVGAPIMERSKNANEMEFLLNAGTTLRVTDQQNSAEGGKTKLFCEIVDPGQSEGVER